MPPRISGGAGFNSTVTVLVGAGTTKYGSLAGIFKGTFDLTNPSTAVFELVYAVQRDAPATTPPGVLTALGKMKLSSFAIVGQTKVIAGMIVRQTVPPYVCGWVFLYV